MSKESYIRGFCKAAEAAGVDPVSLAKYAQDSKEQTGLNFLGKPVSNPTQDHIELLKGLNPDAVAEAAKGLTVGDYLENMLTVDPRQAHFWLGLANRKNPKALKDKLNTSLVWGHPNKWLDSAKLDAIDDFDRRILTGQYANVTNMAARAGLWDPVRHVPTPKGYGLESSKAISANIAAERAKRVFAERAKRVLNDVKKSQ